MLRLRFPYLIALALCCASTTLHAQSSPPLSDTYTFSGQPAQNFGAQPLLIVQPGTTSYVQFNLATLPVRASVSKATLRLFVDAFVSQGSFDVFQVNSAWNENTLTYKTAPGVGISATGGHAVSVAPSSLGQFIVIDVTAAVQNWVQGISPNYGFALVLQGSRGAFSFDSKECLATSHEPELQIVLNGPAGPQGATGATGPAGPQGLAGVAGPQGVPGPIGPVGPAGLQGVAGKDGKSFVFRGAFDSSTSYSVYDVVTSSGSTYLATAPSQGPNNLSPDQSPSAWSLMASAGAMGSQGEAGPQGPQGGAGPQGPVGATGAQGPTGATGAIGPIGPAGPQGPAGTDGRNGTGFNFRGPFDAGSSYAINDVATSGGSSFVAVAATTGPDNSVPDQNSTSWKLMASVGAPGAQGETGAAGPAGVSGPPGAIGPIGPAGAMGPPGPTGPQGPAGPQGPSGSGINRIALLQWWGPVKYTGPQNPLALAYDGRNLWMSSMSVSGPSLGLSKIDPSNGATLLTSQFGIYTHLAWDGVNLWATGRGSNVVSEISGTSGQGLGAVAVGDNASGLAFDGTTLWVANSASSSLTLINTSNPQTGSTTISTACSQPYTLAWSGNAMWVGCLDSNSVLKYSASGTLLGAVANIIAPTSLAYDGTSMWALSVLGTVSKIDPGTLQVIGTYSTGMSRDAQKVATDGTNIWVMSSSAGVAELSGATGQLMRTFTFSGAVLNDMVFDGSSMWVTNELTNGQLIRIPVS